MLQRAVNSSEIKPEMAVDGRNMKKLASLKMDLHLKGCVIHHPGSRQCQNSSQMLFCWWLAEEEGNTRNLKITFWVFSIFTDPPIHKGPQTSLITPLI